jgi:hypothetical protein
VRERAPNPGPRVPPALIANFPFECAVGVAYFLVFGTQEDVLRVWHIWYGREASETKMEMSDTTSSGSACTADGQTAADSESGTALQVDDLPLADLPDVGRTGSIAMAAVDTAPVSDTATRRSHEVYPHPPPHTMTAAAAAAPGTAFGTSYTAGHYTSRNIRTMFSSTQIEA